MYSNLMQTLETRFAKKMPTEAKPDLDAEIRKTIGLQNKGPSKDGGNFTTPNRGPPNARGSGNQIGLMGGGNAPNNAGNSDRKRPWERNNSSDGNSDRKRPWQRNNSNDGNNESPGFSGSGRRSMGQDREPASKRPWGKNNPNAGDNFATPGFNESPGDFNRGPGRRSFGGSRDFYIIDKFREISENLGDLKPREEGQKKFSNQARLWVGNVAPGTIEEELQELFKPYGEWDEFWFDMKKGFGFVRMDYKINAVKAQVELNNKNVNGRDMRIRLSPTPGTSLKIRNLTPFVTTELLEKTFEVFGELERVMVLQDDRGNSACEGIVEYCKKNSANTALRKCQESCLYLSAALRPCIVEPLPFVDDSDGLGEQIINKRESGYYQERERGPRLPPLGSFEDEFGKRWKKLYETYDLKKKEIEDIMKEESNKLDMQMELAKHEHETNMLRKELEEREEANRRQKMQFEQRMSGGYGDYDNNFPKYEDGHNRQNYGNRQDFGNQQQFGNQQNFGGSQQNFGGNQQDAGAKRWEDTHYDSLYNDNPGGTHRGSFGGNNYRNAEQQGGKSLDELSKPLDNPGNRAGGNQDTQGMAELMSSNEFNAPKRAMF